MVHFLDLMNKHEERRVREFVTGAQGEIIRIFEPSKRDIDAIIELQAEYVKEYRDEQSGKDKKEIDISGEQLVKQFFPLLTDIEGMEDLTDEQINEVVENPTLAMIMASHVIEGIVTEVYKMTILSARNRILEADFKMEDARMAGEMLTKMIGLAERENSTAKMVAKIKENTVSVQEAKKKAAKANKKANEVSEKPQTGEPEVDASKLDPNESILARFKQTFDEE